MLELVEVTNPFPGLRPFETDEYHLFFGREGQSDALLERLGRTRFLAVVGTSGSGKSSLIRAGLLPALYGGLMGGAGSDWRVALMRPGDDPVGELARKLGDPAVLGVGAQGGGQEGGEGGEGAGQEADVQTAIIETTLRRGALGLVDAARQARMGAHENLLVVVDQFEELFRFRQTSEGTRAAEDAAAFVKLLLEASGQREVPVYVVLTMRSDYLGDCSRFWGLPEAINAGQYLIPRMTRDERRAAITGPAAVGEGQITQALVNRVLNDMGDNPDHLPIMQHALMRTWAYWREATGGGDAARPVDLEDYELVGGMARALSIHANEAYAELPDERSRALAETLFKALTEKGADNRETRRPAKLREICAITGATESEVVAVVEVFRREGRSFLMPPAGTPLGAETVIDISHESLIRNWDLLAAWVDGEAESARMYTRLADAAVFGGADAYWTGALLQAALEWRDLYRPNAAWAARYSPEFGPAMAFLDASRDARDAELADEERRRAEEAARARRDLEQAQLLAEEKQRLADSERQRADIERQHAEAQAAAQRRELEQAQAAAEQQRRAARRLRWLTVALCLLSLLALGTAVLAMNARAAAKSNEQRALTAQQVARDAEARATGYAESLRNALAGEQMARVSESNAKVEAETRAAEAKAAEARAVAALKKAKEEGERADERAEQARTAELKAQEEKKEADRQRDIARQSQRANGYFRDASALVQRGRYKEATLVFDQAVGGLKELGDLGGVADTYVQLGSAEFGAAREGTDHDSRQVTVEAGASRFRMAADIYGGPQVNSPEKAAAALSSLGTLLVKYANNRPIEFGGSRPANVNPAFGLTPPAQEQALKFGPSDAAKIMGQAMEQYKAALAYYEKAKDPGGAARMAYEIADFNSKFVDDEARREAVKYFEKIVALYPNDDVAVGGLLVRLGNLYYALGESQKGDDYFNRALSAYAASGVGRAEAFSVIASGASKLYEYRTAIALDEKAADEYRARGDRLGEARKLFAAGREYESMPDSRLRRRAVGPYERSLTAYRLWNKPDQATGEDVENLLRIGSTFKDAIKYPLALAAYRLALAFNQDMSAGFSTARVRTARAHTEIGSILLRTNQKQEALESYRRAYDLYQAAVFSVGLDCDSRNEAAMAVDTVGRNIKSLTADLEQHRGGQPSP